MRHLSDDERATRRSLALAAGLIAIAVCLALGLLQNRINHVTWYTDGTSTRTVEYDPILTAGIDFIDVACFVGRPCRVSAINGVHGIYPRDGVPWLVALVGGLILPYGFICAAAFLALAETSGIVRTSLACALAVASAIFLSPAGLIAYRAVRYAQIEYPLLNGVLFAISVLGATAAVGAVWLLAVRPHLRKSA
jgi:hypothetical protein